MKNTYTIRGVPITVDVGDDGILIEVAGLGEISRASVFVEIDEGEIEAHVWDERAEARLADPVTIPMIQAAP